MTLYIIYYVYYMLFCINVFYGKYIIIIIKKIASQQLILYKK